MSQPMGFFSLQAKWRLTTGLELTSGTKHRVTDFNYANEKV